MTGKEVAKPTLSVVERSDLRKLEAKVKDGLASFIVAGKAMKEIRERKLHRESGTFEAYCREKFDIDRTYAHRLIEASEVREELENVAHGQQILPRLTNERQYRELAKVPDEDLPEVAEKLAEIAEEKGDKLTAKDCQNAREAVVGKPERNGALRQESTSKPKCKRCKGTGFEPPSTKGGETAQVVAHYQVYHPQSKPGDKERRKIRDRLKQGYSVEELCDAIDGNHVSPFHCGENDRGNEYHSLELIMRDSSKVDQFIEIKKKPPMANSQKVRSNIRAAAQWLETKNG